MLVDTLREGIRRNKVKMILLQTQQKPLLPEKVVVAPINNEQL